MLFSELYKVMVNKAIFFGFGGGDRPPSLDPPLNQIQSSENGFAIQLDESIDVTKCA